MHKDRPKTVRQKPCKHAAAAVQVVSYIPRCDIVRTGADCGTYYEVRTRTQITKNHGVSDGNIDRQLCKKKRRAKQSSPCACLCSSNYLRFFFSPPNGPRNGHLLLIAVPPASVPTEHRTHRRRGSMRSVGLTYYTVTRDHGHIYASRK